MPYRVFFCFKGEFLMSEESFDVVIIGGGPGGYVSAIRASQLGFKTAVIEKRKNLGGTCLNVGCIPSKALLQASHHYTVIENEVADFGIEVGKPKMNVEKMLKRKDNVIKTLASGIDGLLKKNKVTRYQGAGSLLGDGNVMIADKKDKKTINGKIIIIATGSVVRQLPQLTADEKHVVSSTGALEFTKTPKSMAIIGGGVIGLEIGSVWARLGCEVTVIERQAHIGTTLDEELAKEVQKMLTSQGMNFFVNTEVQETKFLSDGGFTVCFSEDNAKELCCNFEKIMVSVGRVSYTEGLGLENIGVELEPNGMIKVDDNLQTTAENIYAIGDCVRGPMLAHKAEEEGVCLVERLAGHHAQVNYDVIPSIIYTHPEAASVGKTEGELTKAGIDYQSAKFPFIANSRARANGETEGWVKLLADKSDNRILGCHIVAADAGTLIHEVANVMDFAGTANDLAMICHAHPTTNEAVREAALMIANGAAIHM